MSVKLSGKVLEPLARTMCSRNKEVSSLKYMTHFLPLPLFSALPRPSAYDAYSQIPSGGWVTYLMTVWGLCKCHLSELKNETQVSIALAGAGSKIPKSDSEVYFSCRFKHSKTFGSESLHVTAITTKLQGWLHLNSIVWHSSRAKQLWSCDVHHKNELCWLKNSAQGNSVARKDLQT